MQSGRQQLYRPPAPSLSLPSSPSVSSLPLLSPAPPLSLPLPLPLPLPLSLSLSFLSRLSLVTRRHDGLFPPSDSGRGPSRRPGGRGGVGLLSRTPSDGGGGGGGESGSSPDHVSCSRATASGRRGTVLSSVLRRGRLTLASLPEATAVRQDPARCRSFDLCRQFEIAFFWAQLPLQEFLFDSAFHVRTIFKLLSWQ